MDGLEFKANFSSSNKRLFVGNVPKSETVDGFKETFSKLVEGLFYCNLGNYVSNVTDFN